VSPVSVAGRAGTAERQVRHAELAGTIDHFAGTHDPRDNPGPPNRNQSRQGTEEEEEEEERARRCARPDLFTRRTHKAPLKWRRRRCRIAGAGIFAGEVPCSSAILPSDRKARFRRAFDGSRSPRLRRLCLCERLRLCMFGRIRDGHLKFHSQRCRQAVRENAKSRAAVLATRMNTCSLDLPPPLPATQGEFISFRRSSGVQTRAARLIQTLRSHFSPAATLNYVYPLM